LSDDTWLETAARTKVNLRLRIFPRGTDGFHPLETIFCRLDFCDRLRMRRRSAPGVTLRLSGSEPVPEGSENLAARAAELFLSRFGGDGGAEIELEKNVPLGSGLGGGSSDAAAVLRILAGYADPPLEEGELLRSGSELGSDVPFFVTDAPLAVGWGRGDRLLPIPAPDPLPMVVLLPDLQLSTTEAYTRWDTWYEGEGVAESRRPFELSMSALTSWSGIRSLAVNDFEPVVYEWQPRLGVLRDRLAETEPLVAMLSGSGSALFAVYEDEEQRDGVAAELRDELADVRVVAAHGPV
jgi:4-diphosphocytidyl-2-C-methyl-D-erythritol kinase